MASATRVDFVYFDAGGGHRSAATALQSVVSAEERPWDVRLLNLQEALNPLDIFRKVTGVQLQDVYNRMLARGLTIGGDYWLPALQSIIKLNHAKSVKLLKSVWQDRKPDLVVSLIPNLNRALFESLKAICPKTPFVTIMTDLADYPPHFWMERQQQFFICGSARAVQQAQELGLRAAQIIPVSGMILRPNFYEHRPVDICAERTRLGLRPDLPTGLVLFGGEGSNVMHAVAERLGNSSLDLQLIMICGRNERLRKRLGHMRIRNPIFTEGFTKQISYYMQLSDFFIGKPGPGSISEALHMNLPVILEANAWTLPQERYNAEWIREEKYGIVLDSLRNVEGAVKTLLEGGELVRIKARIAALENKAVYEIPPILEKILLEAQEAPSPVFQPRGIPNAEDSVHGGLEDIGLSKP